jgi:PAS domain S-box-containing protein
VTASSVDPKAAHPPIPEAEETIEAIHRGKVDAIVVHGPGGPQIVMLEGADVPYRVLAERMSDGALVLGAGRNILYANRRLAELTGISAEKLIGNTFESLFAADGPQPRENVVTQARLKRQVGTLPVSVWMSPISMGGGSAMLVTLTDLSIFVRAEQIAIAERFARSIPSRPPTLSSCSDWTGGSRTRAGWPSRSQRSLRSDAHSRMRFRLIRRARATPGRWSASLGRTST